jgi:hypothetical protein
MTGTNCDLFTHKSSQSYLNHLVACDKPEDDVIQIKTCSFNFNIK